jgi:O-methyltransferase
MNDNEKLKRRLIGMNPDTEEIPTGLKHGTDLNTYQLTMVGYDRLTNIENLINEVIKWGIKGDMIEAGCWRGGACIFMRKLLNDANDKRMVFVCDSFEGLPKPEHPKDEGDIHWKYSHLSISMNEVITNFSKFGLTENVKFVKGWFADTLPKLNNTYSLIRLDGDMYKSTMDAISDLYPKLNEGGFCIIDDYGAVKGCKEAIHDYFDANGLNHELNRIDWTGYWFRKPFADPVKEKVYQLSLIPSDINEHLITLFKYASECEDVTEFGTRQGVSTFALMGGKRLTCYDIMPCKLSDEHYKLKPDLRFIQKDSLKAKFLNTDLLFIDTFHSYSQLWHELQKHSENVNKYIIIHDTESFGLHDQIYPEGDVNNVCGVKVGEKEGLKDAISDFLRFYPEWIIEKEFTNNNGLTILKRV